MGDKPYVRSEKGIKGTKWEVSDQDKEDFEQEKLIREWLKQQGAPSEFGYQYINNKGNPRNTLIKASISLDQKISDESGAGTFADLIAGSDGRDMVCGGESDDPEREAREIIHGYLSALGFNQGEIKWLIKTLKLSIQESKSLFEKSQTDSEW